jgi:Rod binding domain-containing protein
VIHAIPSEGLGALQNNREADPEKVLRSFESLFLAKLVRGMREAFTSGIGEKDGFGKDMYMMWFDQVVADAMAKEGGIGLKEQLGKYLEHSKTESSPKDKP